MFTKDEITRVLQQFPALNTYGFDVEDNQHSTFEQRRAALAEMTNQINEVAQWLLCNVRLSRGMNYQRSGYGLKHIVGRDCGTYVPQGVFIVAAILIGCKYQIYGQRVCFNISEGSISSIERRLIGDKSRCRSVRAPSMGHTEAAIRMA